MDEHAVAGRPDFSPLGRLRFEPTPCPVCGAGDVRNPFEKDFQGIRLHFGTCTSCETLYQNPRLTVSSLRTVYDSEEFFEGREKNVNYYSFLSGETYLRRTARARIERLRPLARGSRLLEVASAAGFFLAEAKAAGFDAEGIELSNPMAAYARERWQVRVTAGSVEELELGKEAYDRHRVVGRADDPARPSRGDGEVPRGAPAGRGVGVQHL